MTEPHGDPAIALTTVLSTGDPALIAMAKSLLDGEGIEYLLRGEELQHLLGWGSPAEFVVRSEDAERARQLLHDLATPGRTEARDESP